MKKKCDTLSSFPSVNQLCQYPGLTRFNVLITTYEMAKMKSLRKKIFGIKWEVLCVDEAHRLKNQESQSQLLCRDTDDSKPYATKYHSVPQCHCKKPAYLHGHIAQAQGVSDFFNQKRNVLLVNGLNSKA